MIPDSIILRVCGTVTFLKWVLSWCDRVNRLAVCFALSFSKAGTSFFIENLSFITIILGINSLDVYVCRGSCNLFIPWVWYAIGSKVMIENCLIIVWLETSFKIIKRSTVGIEYFPIKTNWTIGHKIVHNPASTSFLIELMMEYYIRWIKPVTFILTGSKCLLHFVKKWRTSYWK